MVIFGAGTAGVGIADQIRDAMVREGLSQEDATARFWLVDIDGLLTDDMGDRLRDYQLTYARPSAEVKRWKREGRGKRHRPGRSRASSAAHDADRRFDGGRRFYGSHRQGNGQAHAERPIIFPLSSPAPMAEATPADLIAWTEGRALIATGSPFPPVTYRGVTYVIGQVNNAMLYPGLCLGAIVSRARRISDSMFAAAANAVSSLVAVRLPGASLLPHVDDLRSVSLTVAVAVAEAAVAEGLAGVEFDDIVQQVRDAMWEPEYRRDSSGLNERDCAMDSSACSCSRAPWCSLGYYGFVVVDTWVFQQRESRNLQRRWKPATTPVQRPPIQARDRTTRLPLIAAKGLIGRLEIPRLELSALIIEGDDSKTLRRAVGHIPGTPLPGQYGNVALTGHRDTFFRPLRNIRANDIIVAHHVTG